MPLAPIANLGVAGTGGEYIQYEPTVITLPVADGKGGLKNLDYTLGRMTASDGFISDGSVFSPFCADIEAGLLAMAVQLWDSICHVQKPIPGQIVHSKNGAGSLTTFSSSIGIAP